MTRAPLVGLALAWAALALPARGDQVQVSTASGYAVLGPPDGVNVSHAGGYAVASPPDGTNVSKAAAYVVTSTPSGTSVSRANVYVVVALDVDDGNLCTADSWDPASGVQHAPEPAGTSCADANPCNGSEVCDGAGVCLAGAPPVVDDENPCTQDSCDPIAGVRHVPLQAGTSCSDGNLCTALDTCNAAGVCVSGVSVIVDDGEPCTADSCDPIVGVLHVPLSQGTICGEGNVCDGSGGVCSYGGTCEPAGPPDIDDENPCTVDSCDPTLGPVHIPAVAGTSCTDSNVCNGSESCDGAGVCASGSAPTIDDGNPCTVDACDPVTGVYHVAATAGTSCSDVDVCNGLESCDGAGACISGVPPPLDDGNPCTLDTCDPIVGVIHEPVISGTFCSDGQPHMLETAGFQWLPPLVDEPEGLRGTFDPGVWPEVEIRALDDTDALVARFTMWTGPGSETVRASEDHYIVNWHTHSFNLDVDVNYRIRVLVEGRELGFLDVDVIENRSEVRNVETDLYVPLVNGSTLPIKFRLNTCASVVCSASDQCHTEGTCDPATGICSDPVAEDGTMCDDGNACTQTDGCVAGACQGTDPKVCGGDACHSAGVCDPGTGECSYADDPCIAVDAGPDLMITSPENRARIAGTVTPAQPGGTLPAYTTRWTFVSGPGSAVIEDPEAPLTGVRLHAEGEFTLRFTATTAYGSVSDDLRIVVAPCVDQAKPVDVMLVLDASGSMLQENKLEAAKDAAKGFVDRLALVTDQVGVVSFGFSATLLSPLSHDAAAVKHAIDLISLTPSTNIGSGLSLAYTELNSVRHQPTSAPVIVLLTDGMNNVGDPMPSVTAIREAGFRAIAIGLGSDADGPFLRNAASSANDYYYAPAATELDWIYANITTSLCRNQAPLVRAGPTQIIAGRPLAEVLTLDGEVHDDGLPVNGRLTSAWSVVDGPDIVHFTDAASPFTTALFVEPGTYTLRLTATDSLATSSSDVTVIIDPEPSLVGAFLSLESSTSGPLAVGGTASLTATLVDSDNVPIAGVPVTFTVSGAHVATEMVLTSETGVARLSYTGVVIGSDTVSAVAHTTIATVTAVPVEVTWSAPGTSPPPEAPPPRLVQGWIGSPADNASVTGVVPITVGPETTLTSGVVQYWPIASPEHVTVLNGAASGGPGTTIASLDTTTLANGGYAIELIGTNSAGERLSSIVQVVAVGDYKPGRFVTTVTDLTVPVTGLPIAIERTYDSFDRARASDFGHGWSLRIASPRLEVDAHNNVTLTEPGGRRVTFHFAPESSAGLGWNFLFFPKYLAEAGVHGTLTSDGCSLLVLSGGQLVCFLSASPDYSPTRYTYTDRYGRRFEMLSDGTLLSVRDLVGNTLTLGPEGIKSSAGDLTVAIERDAEGRIVSITDPAGKSFGYTYDAAGDLVTVALPPRTDLSNPSTYLRYEYDSDHLLLKTIDPRGRTAAIRTYGADGRLASHTDAVGNVTSYTYDVLARQTVQTNPDGGIETRRFSERGDLVQQVDALGRSTVFEYDTARNLVAEIDPLGERITYTYDQSGNPTSRTDPAGRTRRWTFNEYSGLVTQTDELGNVTSVSYDERFVPTSIADALGRLRSFTFDSHGQPLSETDGRGYVSWNHYDMFGNLTARTNRLGATSRFTYDDLGRIVTATDARGAVTSFTYDALGRELTRKEPLESLSTLTTERRRDEAGNIVALRQPSLSREVGFAYDDADRVTSITYPDATTVGYTYNFRGQRLTETDQAGRVTRHTYDQAGQLVETRHPDGTSTGRSYDPLGRIVAIIDERGNATTLDYEPGCACSDRVTREIDPLGRETRHSYDAAGRRVSTVKPEGYETWMTYDVRGRLVTVLHPDATTETYEYDAEGNTIRHVDQEGRATTHDYDAEGRLVAVETPASHRTTYGYDATGNLTTITDANGNTTTRTYDLAGRLTRRTLPLGMYETFYYSAAGVPTFHFDFNGYGTIYRYDALDRLTSVWNSSNSIAFTYTPTGRRATMTDRTGTTTYQYDARDRVTSKATPFGTLVYGHDAAGNITSVDSSNANGTSVTYAYDAANRLISVVDNREAARTDYVRDVGNFWEVLLPNGIRSTYMYDPLGRIVQLTHATTAGPFSRQDVGRTAAGDIASVAGSSGGTAQFSYDVESRLTAECRSGSPGATTDGSITYGYDAVGNRTSRQGDISSLEPQSFSYDQNDRTTSLSFDANGNTLTAFGHQYAYDYRGLLRSVDGNAVSFVYDGDGNRVTRTAGGVTTSYLVDELSPTGFPQVLEEIVGGTVNRVYTYGGTPLSQRQLLGGTWTTSYYGTDAHGSVTFLTDTLGNVTDRYAYDAFGNLLAAEGSTPNERLYTNERLDLDTGTYYLRARDYDPRLGRFLQADPYPGCIGDPPSLHRYAYARNDPLAWKDPSGRMAVAETTVLKQVPRLSAPAVAAVGVAVACVFQRTATALEAAMENPGGELYLVTPCIYISIPKPPWENPPKTDAIELVPSIPIAPDIPPLRPDDLCPEIKDACLEGCAARGEGFRCTGRCWLRFVMCMAGML